MTTTKPISADKESERSKHPAKASGPKSGAAEAAAEAFDSQIVSFGDRMTYTFAFGREVGSIHFDKNRGEIFYKGHNIRNMDLEPWQMQVLEQLRQILRQDGQWSRFAEPYGKVLDKIALEKKMHR